jgi:mono/diheme cytochrome c family protein
MTRAWAIAAAAVAVAIAAAQPRTTGDGVYTETQAARGQAVYAKSCASCHGADLDGIGQAPALADPDFAKEWNGQPLSDLFERIRTTMPGDAPGTLPAADVADVLAFVLKKGGHPAGANDLPGDAAALASVSFSARPPAVAAAPATPQSATPQPALPPSAIRNAQCGFPATIRCRRTR